MLSRSRLESLLAHFPKLTIGLVGDLFLDRYLDIEPGVEEWSIETGLESFQVAHVRNYPGALGTVMNNLAALRVGRLVPLAVIGDDGQGYDLLQELRRLPIDDAYVIQDPTRLTPTYTKPMKQDASGCWRELNRLDLRSREPLSAASQQRLHELLPQVFQNCDGVIVLDQINETDWGVVNTATRCRLAELAGQFRDKLVFVDSRSHLAQFTFGVLKGNRAELLAAMGEPIGSQVDIGQVARQLSRRTGCPCYATLGQEGILVAETHEQVQRSASLPVSGPIDIVGAGDSTTSGIVASILSGASFVEAAEVGNLVASLTIQQLGVTGTASPEEVLTRHAQFS